MKEIGKEYDSVQEPIINYVTEKSVGYTTSNERNYLLDLGWKYLTPKEALNLRGDETQIILKQIFIPQILKLNPFLTEEDAVNILSEINRITPNIEGNLSFWQFLKGHHPHYIQREKRNFNIKVIDTDNIDNNEFHVTQEFEYTNGVKIIRQDIVFFINGIPVIFIEAKSPRKIQGIDVALSQVKRYHESCPELLSVEQIFVLTHLVKFLYGATWNVSSKTLYNWKEETQGDFEFLVKSFFDRKRVIKLITDYILFTRKDDSLQKVILRPHQMRAVEKVIERAKDPEKRRGLVWHTQGSGKTYTMIVVAKKLIEDPIFENPTVIMLVDRNELESQLFGNIQSVGIEFVEVAQSKEHLEFLLRSDKRGLIVSMIHKFEGMPPNINKRSNIFVLVDEAHRTTSGKLGNYLMGALPNATFIGFTGTPIDKTSYGQGTFVIFGRDDPPKGYLDKYSIAESINDGTTLPLHYSLAPNEFTIDKELLEKEFLELKEAEGISDVEELNKVLEKAVRLKNAIKSRNRVEKIAKFIAEHFKNYVEPLGYKAFVVAVDREACTTYKEELDKHLPPEYSAVVYSQAQNDPESMTKYYLSEEEEKRIRKDFLDPDKLPKILIVTNKLLTGFDAPILYCMYLDKPMRDHVLLQTIARVNRPYEKDGKKKPAGFVLDFIGIFSNLEKALAFDSSDIEGVLSDIEKLKERFKMLIGKAKEEYISKIHGSSHDKKVEFLINYFEDENKRKEFNNLLKELLDIYNIISPDPFLRPYLDDLNILISIYCILKETYESDYKVSKEFTKKVEELVQKHVKQGDVEYGLEVYEINELTLKELEKRNISDTNKVFNLKKSIDLFVEREVNSLPYLVSIGERAESIIEQYRDRQMSTQEALEQLKILIKEINEAKKEQIEKGMNTNVFSIYWILKKEDIKEAEKLAYDFEKAMNDYPYWKFSESQERELRRNLITTLLSSTKDLNKVTEIVRKIINYFKRS